MTTETINLDVFHNMIRLMDTISIRVEIRDKENYRIWRSDHPLSLINSFFSSETRLLTRLWANYLLHDKPYLYKVKTNLWDKNHTHYDEGAVAGLQVIDPLGTHWDETPIRGLSVMPPVFGRTFLEEDEIILFKEHQPEFAPSIQVMLKKEFDTYFQNQPIRYFSPEIIAQIAAPILEIDPDLVFNQTVPNDRKLIMIKRAMENTIIPTAQWFVTEIDKQLGIGDDSRLALVWDQDRDWIEAWGELSHHPNPAII